MSSFEQNAVISLFKLNCFYCFNPFHSYSVTFKLHDCGNFVCSSCAIQHLECPDCDKYNNRFGIDLPLNSFTICKYLYEISLCSVIAIVKCDKHGFLCANHLESRYPSEFKCCKDIQHIQHATSTMIKLKSEGREVLFTDYKNHVWTLENPELCRFFLNISSRLKNLRIKIMSVKLSIRFEENSIDITRNTIRDIMSRFIEIKSQYNKRRDTLKADLANEGYNIQISDSILIGRTSMKDEEAIAKSKIKDLRVHLMDLKSRMEDMKENYERLKKVYDNFSGKIRLLDQFVELLPIQNEFESITTFTEDI